jgi:hypothetical protein
VVSAPDSTIADARVETTESGLQGVHVAAPRTTVADCVVESGEHFAIGSSGGDDGSHVTGNTCVSNRIGATQFGHDVAFDGNAPPATIEQGTVTLSGGASPAAILADVDGSGVDGVAVEWAIAEAPERSFAIAEPRVHWQGEDQFSVHFSWAADPGPDSEVTLHYALRPRNTITSWSVDGSASTGLSPGATARTHSVPRGSFSMDTPTETPAVPALSLDDAGAWFDAPVGASEESVGGAVRFAWDENALYLAAAIADDTHAQPYTGTDTWSGDSLQVGITPDRSAGFLEYTLALTAEGPQAYRRVQNRDGSGGLTDALEVAIERDVSAAVTHYRAAIPWAELGVDTVAAGDTLAATVVVNDNDGDGRTGYVTWGRGVAASKDASQFNRLSLTADQ